MLCQCMYTMYIEGVWFVLEQAHEVCCGSIVEIITSLNACTYIPQTTLQLSRLHSSLLFCKISDLLVLALHYIQYPTMLSHCFHPQWICNNPLFYVRFCSRLYTPRGILSIHQLPTCIYTMKFVSLCM